MRLGHRVRKLELACSIAGRCRRCIGVCALVDERERQATADAKGCPACGKISKLIVLEPGREERCG